MCGSDINYNPPAPVDYGDALREGLEAQADPELNRALFEAESNTEYGRKAYARLNNEVIHETLYGKKSTYDSEGRIVTGFSGGQGARYQVISQPTLTNQIVQKRAKGSGPRARSYSYNVSESSLTENYVIYDVKEEKFLTGEGRTNFASAEEALAKVKDLGGGDLGPIYAKDVDGNIIVDKSKAGQTHYSGDGIVATIAGTQEHTFVDADGNEVTRRIGFDENGNPMGVAGVARDLEQIDKAQRFATEIQMMKDYGDEFTTLYREQGDIQGALDEVKRLAGESAIPEQEIDANVNTLANSVQNMRSKRNRVGGPFEPQVSNQPVRSPSMTDTGTSLENPGAQDEAIMQSFAENRQATNSSNPNAGGKIGGASDSTSTNELLPSGSIDIDEKLGPEFAGMSRRELANFDNAMGVTRQDYAGLTFAQAMGQEPVPGQTSGQKIVQEANRVGRRLGYRGSSDVEANAETQGPNLTDGQAETALQNSDRNYQGPVRGSGSSGTGNYGRGQRGGPRNQVVPGEMPDLDANGYPLDGYMLMDDGKYHYRIGGETLMVADTMQQLQESVAQMDNQPTMSSGDPDNLLSEKRIDKASANFGNTNLTALRDELSRQALDELKLDDQLSARDLRTAQQQARSATTARGRSRSTSAILAELKNNEALKEQRKLQRREFAGGVTQLEGGFATSEAELDLQAQFQNQGVQAGLVQLNQQAEMFNAQQDLAYDNMEYNAVQQDEARRIQVAQINEQYRQSGLATDRAFATQRVGLEQATASDPLMAISGRPSGAGVVNADAVYGASASQPQTPQMFNPNIGAQFVADQASNLNDYNIAFGNQQAQVSAGRSQMVGNMVSGLFQGVGNAVNPG